MNRHPSKTRAYKDTTAQQLRSFYEMARLGSLAAAATSLGLANPTVWQQVHALQREFGEPLMEPHGRGCRLTDAGQLLADLANPLVEGLASLKRRFRDSRAKQPGRLVVATTPRVLLEDLPPCMVEFRQRYPDVAITLREETDEDVHAQVEAGKADIGVIGNRCRDPLRPWAVSPWLAYEPLYDLDILLVTRKDHPLASRRHVRPQDLRGYPLVNGLNAYPDAVTMGVLERIGLLEAQPHLIEAFFIASMKCYVKLGFGIGLTVGFVDRLPDPDLHVRAMSRYFGRPVVYQLTRKGTPPLQTAVAFTNIVKSRLHRPPA
jgi:DNA-binding transcriptional LysR family regulator